MIEDTEKLKSGLESKAEHLAGQTGPIHTWRYSTYLSAYQKCNQGCFRIDG